MAFRNDLTYNYRPMSWRLQCFLMMFLSMWKLDSVSAIKCYDTTHCDNQNFCTKQIKDCKECLVITNRKNHQNVSYLLGCMNTNHCITEAGKLDLNDCYVYSKQEDSDFCCCHNEFCNDPATMKIIHKQPTVQPTLSTKPEPPLPVSPNPIRMALTILLPLLAFSVLIVVTYYFYQRCKIKRSHRHETLTQQQSWNPDALPLIRSANCNFQNEVCPSGVSRVPIPIMDKSVSTSNVFDKIFGEDSSATENGTCRALMLVHSAVNTYKLKQLSENQPWWRIDEVLVRGKMACVQKCSQVSHDGSSVLQQAVIKTLCDKNLWQNEVDVYNLCGLNHPNILRFISAEQPCPNQSIYWLILSYQEMGSVYDYLQNNTLSWAQALTIASGLARGLNHLHEEQPSSNKPSIAHRDIKSKNVLLNYKLEASIADFGLALQLPKGTCFNNIPSQVGTHRYMSPEVLQGIIGFDRHAFLSVDVYSMALVLWEIMSRSHLPSASPDSSCSSIQAYKDNNDETAFLPTSYCAPYEAELDCKRPDKLNMKEVVVVKNCRPLACDQWFKHQDMRYMWRTLQECWDTDCEARLSANCVAERIDRLLENEFQASQYLDKLILEGNKNVELPQNSSFNPPLEESSSNELDGLVRIEQNLDAQNYSNEEDSAIESGTLDSGTGHDRISLSSSKSSSSCPSHHQHQHQQSTKNSTPHSLPLQHNYELKHDESAAIHTDQERIKDELDSTNEKHSSVHTIVPSLNEPLTPKAGTPIEC